MKINKNWNGMSRIYKTWISMRYRCRKGLRNYETISVCKEWEDFNNFYEWAINNGYNDNLVIDRIDSKSNYCPNNCQWITLSENTAKSNKICQHRKANKGTYYGISPKEIYYEFDNANAFSREHELNAGCVRQVANKEKKTHKGWKFGFISEKQS